jgi:uncharacterized protein YndB with AHSA1/START domain
MSTTPAIPPITGTVTVNASIEEAFRIFTASFDKWWPHQYHIGQAEVAELVMESGEGGRWYERGVDGSECDWGRVLVWAPPNRLVLTWQINGQWRFDPDPAHASEIEVRFTADGRDQTTVEVEQRHFERLVGGDIVHGTIKSGGSWTVLLEGYADAVAQED